MWKKLLVASLQYDEWCVRTVEAGLTWLNEWLSLTQSQFEWGMIIIYQLAGSVQVIHRPWYMLFSPLLTCLVTFIMWTQMTSPSILRLMRRFDPGYMMARVCFSQPFFALMIFQALAPPIRWRDMAYVCAWIGYLLFLYSICITDTGKRGRRRKEAISKVKELFWMPQPVRT